MSSCYSNNSWNGWPSHSQHPGNSYQAENSIDHQFLELAEQLLRFPSHSNYPHGGFCQDFSQKEFQATNTNQQQSSHWSSHQPPSIPMLPYISQNVQRMYKTKLCDTFERCGKCRYGYNCQYAHGKSELREPLLPANYKTKNCWNLLKDGFCAYGDKCIFVHQEEWKRPVKSLPIAAPAGFDFFGTDNKILLQPSMDTVAAQNSLAGQSSFQECGPEVGRATTNEMYIRGSAAMKQFLYNRDQTGKSGSFTDSFRGFWEGQPSSSIPVSCRDCCVCERHNLSSTADNGYSRPPSMSSSDRSSLGSDNDWPKAHVWGTKWI